MLLKKSNLLHNKTIQICGSKSISNRLLILHFLFRNIKIENTSDAQDTFLLQQALESKKDVIDVHHAGTAMRFLTAYFAQKEGRNVVLTGSERMLQRPIKDLVEALLALGADIQYLGVEGYPPLKITGKKLNRDEVVIPSGISSQFITALMLIAPKLENGLTIHLEGKITSRPYIEMTLKTLTSIGVSCEFDGRSIKIFPLDFDQKLSNIFYFEVESDWSSASYYYAMAAIGRGIINLRNFQAHSYQADSRIKEIYWDFFGINTISDTQEHRISICPEPFVFPEIIKIDMNDCPDIVQTVCVTAAALQIPFEITGLETLKIKETDRLQALHKELQKIGCETEITENSIASVRFFEPEEPIFIKTYNDHRMAMSFAPYCLKKEITIEDENVVEKSYPKFWEDLKEILDPIN